MFSCGAAWAGQQFIAHFQNQAGEFEYLEQLYENAHIASVSVHHLRPAPRLFAVAAPKRITPSNNLIVDEWTQFAQLAFRMLF